MCTRTVFVSIMLAAVTASAQTPPTVGACVETGASALEDLSVVVHAASALSAKPKVRPQVARRERLLSELIGMEELMRLDPLEDVYFTPKDVEAALAHSRPLPMKVKGWNTIGYIELTRGDQVRDAADLHAQARAIYFKQFPPREREESRTSVYLGTTTVYCNAIDVAKARAGIGDEDCLSGVGTHVFRNR